MSDGFYAQLKQSRQDDVALSDCIENVVNKLQANATADTRPGMLLGKIQSGKTRGFVGAIARSFDCGTDIAIVLTKGTKTLSAQTVARLSSDFRDFIDDDQLMVIDIMNPPGKLRRSELNRKLVIVSKKQAKNLERLLSFFDDYPSLSGKKILLIDDEADLASIRFVKKKGETSVEQGTIADQMDKLRGLANGISFLQVTATPYSLYLQPDEYLTSNNTGFVFRPKKPVFTELLPIHGGYVGGDDYFGEFEDDDPRSYLFVEVDDSEHDVLRRQDERRINKKNVLTSTNTKIILRSIITFVLAACVRRWQQEKANERLTKYSMVIHNDTQRAAHAWQDRIMDWLFESLQEHAASSQDKLKTDFDIAFDDLTNSVLADGGQMPQKNEAFSSFIDALTSDDVVRERVNSDGDVLALLDQNAELKLRTPFNIFIGGNILDRGITIPNLISFYYGRNPRTMQADTVLQHSRMYGNRSRRDLAVTRFYTSQIIYDRLHTINQFENALRQAFENGAHDQGVVFIETDSSQGIRPCAPNKILLSNVVSVQPGGLVLPTSFQTTETKKLRAVNSSLLALIDNSWINSGSFHIINRELAFEICDIIKNSFEFIGEKFEWAAMKGLIDYYLNRLPPEDRNILVRLETGRELDRLKSGDKSGKSILGTRLRSEVLSASNNNPTFVLLEQAGTKALNWRGEKFWWPILGAPNNAEPCVFAAKTTS